MFRRILFSGLAVAVVGFLVFGRHAASYVRTAGGWVRDSVKSAVPVDFEIERARGMVKAIMPEVRKNMQVIAKEEVEVERLAREIARLEKKQETDRSELASLRTQASSGKETFHFAGRSYTLKQVKTDLANRFDRFQTSDATLNSLRDMHTARLQALDAARQKLEGMLTAKRKLEVEVENLQARSKMVEVAQTSSNCSFDDSHLGRVKELIDELRSRLSVEEKLVHAEGEFQSEIPVSEPSTDNIVEKVTNYLNGGKEATIEVANASNSFDET
ncbi:MAG: hypothetical protein IT427_08995 [Pirellulales bacterium]|nr:hypothetical protein [Pirellulales bacterium]